MHRANWYFIGLMICISNAGVFGSVVAIVSMLLCYLIAAKEEG